jgi:hypothetical protein
MIWSRCRRRLASSIWAPTSRSLGTVRLLIARVADPDPHYFWKLDVDPDPHCSTVHYFWNLDLDPDPHCSALFLETASGSALE